MSTHDETLNLDAMIDDVKTIAHQALQVNQEEKTNNHKIATIGAALIAQKGSIADLADVQASNHKELTDTLETTVVSQKHIVKSFDNAADNINALVESHQNQINYVDTLSKLQVQHTTLVKATDEGVAKANLSLDAIQDGVKLLKETIASFDVQNQTEIIAKAAQEITNRINGHIEERISQQDIISGKIAGLADSLADFYGSVEKQTESITNIEMMVKTGQDHTISLNEKFDRFLEAQNLQKISKATTLEDMFPATVEPESQGEVEVPEYSKDPIEISKPTKKRGLFRRRGGK